MVIGWDMIAVRNQAALHWLNRIVGRGDPLLTVLSMQAADEREQQGILPWADQFPQKQ